MKSKQIKDMSYKEIQKKAKKHFKPMLLNEFIERLIKIRDEDNLGEAQVCIQTCGSNASPLHQAFIAKADFKDKSEKDLVIFDAFPFIKYFSTPYDKGDVVE